jgi:serine/threonine protein kinase/tetratricopeptide (TPR) repeat protein
MGEVWRARDARVDRVVALKVLPENMVENPALRARFEREARMLANLNHPGIATLYSFEELSGRYLLAMELVEGDGLDERIAAGPLPVSEIVSLALQIAEALAAAHEKGVIHRDLKPANIKVSASGRVKLLDFGLARKWQEEQLRSIDETREHTLLTQKGVLVGTVPYMSPEQLSGRQMDHRADLFSFGIILFEMVVGERPFHGLSTAELATSILRDSPPPVNELRRDVPAGLAGVIRHCLQKEPGKRPADAREIVDALRRPGEEHVAAAASDVVSIAVLPFSDMSPTKDQAYLCEGMAEEIMNALARVAGIRVASRMSTFHASRQSDNPSAIARALNVSQILEGSIRTAAGRMRVTARLTDAFSGFQLWSARYDRKADDIFAVQDEIAAGVVDAITQRLVSAPTAIRLRSQVRNLEAYHLYLKGKHLRYLNNDLAGALRAFEQAVALDPLHGPSWVLLAEVNVICASYGMKESAEALAAAKTALDTAAGLLGETGAGWYVACGIALIEKRWDDAHRAIVRSTAIEPNFVTALGWLGIILSLWGKIEEALPYLQRARQIEALAPYPYSLTALALLHARRVEEADRYVEQALGFDATNSLSLWLAGAIQVALRRFDLAVALMEQASSVASGNVFVHDLLGWALAAGGRGEEARRILEERRARPGPAGGTLGEVWLLAALGDLDEAFSLLNRVADQTNVFVLMTGLPGFDPMRSDPRFAAFLNRVTPVLSEAW